MSGCALRVNQREHVGLRQLSALADALTRSSLGPVTRYTLVLDEASGESAALSSCLRLLESLEATRCPVGQLALETVGAHHKRHRTGSRSLLFLAGVWSRAALECLQRGISIPHIISAMSEGLDICLVICRANTVSTDDLSSVQSQKHTGKSQGLQLEPASSRLQLSTPEIQKVPPRLRKIKLSHSRHFCQAEADGVASKRVDVVGIGRAVSHGRADTMDLVVKACLMQSKNDSRPTFDVDKVVTCVLPDVPEERVCVLPGCVALLSPEQVSVAQQLKDQPLHLALIDGDLCVRYRHVGFNKPPGGIVGIVSDVPPAVGSSSKEEEWTETVLAVLVKLNVNLILLTGAANEQLTQRCVSNAVLVVGNLKAPVLRAFADATGAVPVSYVAQLTQHCVGTGARVAVLKDIDGEVWNSSAVAVNISSGGRGIGTGLVTAILGSRVRAKLQAIEDEFWSCAYRLHWALRDGAVLPGGGAVEALCVRGLRTHACPACQAATQRRIVLDLMAYGFTDYVSTVVANGGGHSKAEARALLGQHLKDTCRVHDGFSKLLFDGEPGSGDDGALGESVFDNVSVKTEAWRRALDLVFIVLQTDAEVITGVDAEAISALADVSLL